jgi:hypothetical protein
MGSNNKDDFAQVMKDAGWKDVQFSQQEAYPNLGTDLRRWATCRKSCKVQVRVTSTCNHVPALSVAHKHCNRVWALADFTAFTLPSSTSAAMDMLLVVPVHILTSKHPRLFQHLGK